MLEVGLPGLKPLSVVDRCSYSVVDRCSYYVAQGAAGLATATATRVSL